MHRFGQPVLFDKYIPDLKVPKWGWLLKVKTFKNKQARNDGVQARADAQERATKFANAVRTDGSCVQEA